MSELAILGSKSSHGGSIISANAHFTCDGIKAVVNGDQHSCPIPGHGITSITATSIVKDNGVTLVRVGDQAGCGAVITTGYAACDSD